jgi:branched-chain amino acid transport system permease protein
VTALSPRLRSALTSLAGPALISVILLVGPAVLSPQHIDAGALCALYLVAGVGLHVLMGYTGQVSFGQGGFWAIGAYAVGVLTVRLDVPVVAAIVLSLIITGVCALLIGWPVTQLRGHYIAVATLALALIVVDLANNLEDLTGGNAGLSGIPTLELFGRPMVGADFYRLCWLVALVVLVIAANLSRSRTGRAFRSVGADESGSQALGVPSAAYRLRAFIFAAVLAGLGGALYAPYLGFLSPEAFSVELSALFIIVIIVGGMRSPYGALVGAVAVTALTQWLNSLTTRPDLPARLAPALSTLCYGLLIFLVMRLSPSGVLPLIERALARVVAALTRKDAGSAQRQADPLGHPLPEESARVAVGE